MTYDNLYALASALLDITLDDVTYTPTALHRGHKCKVFRAGTYIWCRSPGFGIYDKLEEVLYDAYGNRLGLKITIQFNE